MRGSGRIKKALAIRRREKAKQQKEKEERDNFVFFPPKAWKSRHITRAFGSRNSDGKEASV